ncbi:MAG: patatin family protein [Oscillospiraceae bacterium]
MKIGLVLEGGAHRTIFSCGVMDALLEAKINADYVVGTSAGITYGMSYVARQKGRNREMFRRYVRSSRYMGIPHLLNPFNRSYYNLKYVFDTIPNQKLPVDYNTLRTFQGEAIAVVTNMETGEPEYLPVGVDDPSWKVLQATCALPLLFKPISINGRMYADGGVADSIPFMKAIEEKCDRIIVVLTRERSYRKTAESATNYIVRHYQKKYPAYAEKIRNRHERYNACIEEIAKREENGEIYVIAPEDTLQVGRTEKDVSKLMALYAQGYAITMQQLNALKAYMEDEVQF